MRGPMRDIFPNGGGRTASPLPRTKSTCGPVVCGGSSCTAPTDAITKTKSPYLEVVKPERLVYKHGGSEENIEDVSFSSTVLRRPRRQDPRHTANGVCVAARTRPCRGEVRSDRRRQAKPWHASRSTSRKRWILPTAKSSAPASSMRRRSRVFQAFGNPNELKHWWGPTGFTNTIQEFDLRPGGVWRLVMHGFDGTDYHNESVFTEVVTPERVVFEHREPVHRFRMTMTFLEQGGKTRLTWCMRFESKEEFEKARLHCHSQRAELRPTRGTPRNDVISLTDHSFTKNSWRFSRVNGNSHAQGSSNSDHKTVESRACRWVGTQRPYRSVPSSRWCCEVVQNRNRLSKAQSNSVSRKMSSFPGRRANRLLATVPDSVHRDSRQTLLTGYLGGAVATHVHAQHDAFRILFPVIFGVIIWLGIFLREPRLRVQRFAVANVITHLLRRKR